jgi:pimeloyl-ACP methyl ester carboxylesterase
MPLLEIPYGQLFYVQRGTNTPPLVCIHGAGGTHQHWGIQFRELSKYIRVIALDLPGHGRSSGPGCRSVSEYSDMLIASLDALGLNQVILAGHSMGGAVALWSALSDPERVAGLALIGTGGKLPVLPTLFDYLEQGNLVETVRSIVQRAYSSKTPPSLRAMGEAAFMQMDRQVFYDDLLACAGYDVMSRLHTLTCPTLIICGEDDQITPPKFSHHLHTAIEGSTLTIVPDAGHMVLLEQADVVDTLLWNFIQQQIQP